MFEPRKSTPDEGVRGSTVSLISGHCFSVLRQFLHRQEQIIGLRQDRIFQNRLVGDERILRRHAPDGRIELSKSLSAMRAAISAPYPQLSVSS